MGGLPAMLLALLVSGPSAAARLQDAADLVRTALTGPFAAFRGVQRAEAATDSGLVRSQVRVQADGRGRVRREYVGGPANGTVLLQLPDATYRRDGSGEWLQLPASRDMPAGERTRLLLASYRVEAGPRARLLGRPCVPLRILPRHAGRPSRRIWLDPSTGVSLRDDLWAPDGRLLSSTAFTELTLGPQPETTFAAPPEHAHPRVVGPGSYQPVASAREAEERTGLPVPVPGRLPPGFRVVQHGVMEAGSGRLLPAVRLSDGLAAVSIFRRGRGPGLGRGSGRSALHLQPSPGTVVLAWESPTANYLLVGDLSANELLRVARSLP